MTLQKQSLLSQRGQMFLAGFGFWLFLMFWSISAFWQHIDSTKPTYLWAARVGACSAEFVILAMVFLHCFNKHIGVRKWALILGTALVVAVVAHTAGLRGLDEAIAKQTDTEERLAEQLTKMSKEQMGQSQRKAKIAETAQKQLADTVRAGNEKVKESSIFPRWYLDGWMYGVLFAMSAVFLAVPIGMMGNRLDIDANFDGVADHLQVPQPAIPAHSCPATDAVKQQWPEEIDTRP
jgi:cell division protein FtsB